MGGFFGGGDGGGISKLIAPSATAPVPKLDPVQTKAKERLRAEAGDKGASILIGDAAESVAQPATKRLLGD
jgi:hypothetical protein